VVSHPRSKRYFGAGAMMLGLIAGIGIFSAAPVHAQGLFGYWFGGGAAREPEAPAPSRGPAVAYCVRLCDGGYFPMAKDIGKPHSSPEKICSTLCPATATRVFMGSEIEQASASNGDLYSKLQNALLYRERLVAGCSCNGKDVGNAAIDARSDPTLRKGDIVVTALGPVVFNGTGRVPHQPADFTAAKHHPGLNAELRRQVSSMRISRPVNVAAQRSKQPAAVASSGAITAPLVLTVNPIAPVSFP